MAVAFALAGGLGLFLYGMKMMSDGLEKAAGAKMRGILEFFTKNRFVGMLVGILFTAVVQSSSATTVMVVSFVNSGLMNLLQASGVILGANIGTTVTSQLISFNLSEIAPLFVMCGVIMVMFCKRQGVKKTGEVLLGFGILFMGLNTMSSAMSTLRESPYIVNVLSSLKSSGMAVLVGFVVTAVLQSSSATVGIVLLMAKQGLLAYPICFYLILGCNMGSCVSALLASLGGNKDAKRAAWIHFLFNIIGSAIIYMILAVGLNPIADKIMSFSGGNIARAVANTHTLIKVVEVIIMFPFMGYVVKATYRIVPGKDKKADDEFMLKYIEEGQIIAPTTVMVNAINEIEHMGMLAVTNLKASMEALCNRNSKLAEEVCHREEYINYLNKKITNYLVKANELELPLEDIKMLGGMFHVVNDIERVGDYAKNFAESAQECIKNNLDISDKGRKQLREMTEMTVRIFEYSLDMFTHKNQQHMQDILDLEDAIDIKEKKLQKSHVKRLTKNECTPEAGMVFSDTASGLERIADHATNIAFAILEPEEHIEDEEE